MRGNVMTIQPDNSGVTMLRTTGGKTQEPASVPGDTEMRADATEPQLSEDDRTQPNSSSHNAGDRLSPAASAFSSLARYRKQGIFLLAFVAVVAVAVKQAGINLPFTEQKTINAAVVVPHSHNNASGITPPDLVIPGTKGAVQKFDPPVLPQSSDAIKLPASEPTISASQTEQPSVVPRSSSPSVTPAIAPEDVHNIADTHFNTRMDSVATLTPQAEVQSPRPDVGNDRLFIEMHKQLDIMSNQMKDLQDKLESTQQALNERVSMGLGKIDGRLDELQHREDLIENQKKNEPQPLATSPQPKATQQANDKGKETAQGNTEHHTAKKVTKDPAAAPAPAPLPHYTVQAGAPDIAILMDSSGTPLRVQPGTSLDGWGNVLAVTASGNGWIVKTEHGTIR